MRSYCSVVFIILLIAFSPAYGESVFSSDSPEVRTVDRVVARVNFEPVTLLEVRSLQEANPDLTYSTALNALIDQRLVLSWARSNKITVSKEDILKAERVVMENSKIPEDRFDEVLESRGQDREAFRHDLEEQILVNRALSTALEPAMRIDEQKVEQRYNELYPPTKTFTIRHILLKPDASAGNGEAAAKERAEHMMDRIRDGEPFEDMALRYSEDSPSAAQGGFLGTFREGELLPELEKLVLELEPGELGGPVRTSMGFHILRLDSRDISEPPPLSRVRDRIRADVFSRREPEVREQWLKELRDKAFIEIFPDGERNTR